MQNNNLVLISDGTVPIRYGFIDRNSGSRFYSEDGESDEIVFPGYYCKVAQHKSLYVFLL